MLGIHIQYGGIDIVWHMQVACIEIRMCNAGFLDCDKSCRKYPDNEAQQPFACRWCRCLSRSNNFTSNAGARTEIYASTSIIRNYLRIRFMRNDNFPF